MLARSSETSARQKTGPCSSTVARARAADAFAAKPDPVRQPLSWRAIDRRRRELGVSHKALIAAASGRPGTYWDGRAGRQKTRAATLRLYEAALERLALARHAAPPLPVSALRALVLLTEGLVDARLVARALTPRLRNPARTFAVYLLAVELEIENAKLARALGCKRQNVHQLRNDVEGLRDDAGVDALLNEMAALLKGEGGA